MKSDNFTLALICLLTLFFMILAIIAINVQPVNEYKRCSVVSKVRTGKIRPNVATKFVGQQHETIITRKCGGGVKVQVTWENH